MIFLIELITGGALGIKLTKKPDLDKDNDVKPSVL